ncbi:MAG: hypothetical protein ACMXYL_01045 [Candidatus Woesearchaeota archaeon]
MPSSLLLSVEKTLGKITPDFDEVTVFLISFTFTVLFILDYDMRIDTITGLVNPFNLLMFLFLFSAKILAWYHAFSNAKKSRLEKNILIIFGLIMPVGIGLQALESILTYHSGILFYLLIFPILNLVYALLLLFLYRTTSIIHSFDPRDAEKSEVFFGMGIIVLFVIIMQYMLGMHWAITYSMGIVYATFLGRIPYLLQQYFGRIKLSSKS